MTAHPHPEQARRPHARLLLVAMAGLAAVLIGLVAWVLSDRYTGHRAPKQNTSSLIDNFTGAANANDAKAVAALFTRDAEVWMPSGSRIVGASAVATYLVGPGLHVERTAPVSAEGDFATTFVRFTVPGVPRGRAVMVFRVKDGKIVRVWSFQLGITKPFDNTPMP